LPSPCFSRWYLCLPLLCLRPSYGLSDDRWNNYHNGTGLAPQVWLINVNDAGLGLCCPAYAAFFLYQVAPFAWLEFYSQHLVSKVFVCSSCCSLGGSGPAARRCWLLLYWCVSMDVDHNSCCRCFACKVTGADYCVVRLLYLHRRRYSGMQLYFVRLSSTCGIIIGWGELVTAWLFAACLQMDSSHYHSHCRIICCLHAWFPHEYDLLAIHTPHRTQSTESTAWCACGLSTGFGWWHHCSL